MIASENKNSQFLKKTALVVKNLPKSCGKIKNNSRIETKLVGYVQTCPRDGLK